MAEFSARRPTATKERLRRARAWVDGRELHQPSRNVIVRSPARILRELASVKMSCKVPCESGLEYDHYVVLDVRRDVAGFYAQPELVLVADGSGFVRRHYPDVRVEYVSGRTEVHEVKPSSVAARPEIVAFHRRVAAEYARRGQSYLVVTEEEIRREPRLRNAHLIRSARRHRATDTTRTLLRDALAEGPLPLGVLQDLMGTGPVGRMEVLGMTLRGEVHMDWEETPIGPDIAVALSDGAR